MPPRRFTLEEASGLLPRLREILPRMQEAKHQHDRLQETVRQFQRTMSSNGHLLEAQLNQARQEMARAAAQVNGLIGEVQALGCEVKDIDAGLVDFRSEMEGREMYLCWKLGERAIAWWHELEAGFAGRQPLPKRR